MAEAKEFEGTTRVLRDVISKKMYEIPEEKFLELSKYIVEESNQSPKISLRQRIENLDFNKTYSGELVEKAMQVAPEIAKKIREALLWLLDVTVTVGKEIFHFGKIFLEFILEVIAHNPTVGIGVLVVGLLAYAIPQIPLIGAGLSSVILPIATVAFVGIPAVQAIFDEVAFKSRFEKMVKMAKGEVE